MLIELFDSLGDPHTARVSYNDKKKEAIAVKYTHYPELDAGIWSKMNLIQAEFKCCKLINNSRGINYVGNPSYEDLPRISC